MPVLILESVERSLASRLLEVSDIFDIYRSSSGRWARAVIAQSAVPPEYEAEDGETVVLTPRELLAIVMPIMEYGNDSLFLAIRRLQKSPVEALSDLYDRLQALDIKRVSSPETRGLFLLLGKLSEERRIFENAT